jgi:hypothetical protein
MRAKRDHPYISLPVTWDEVRLALDRRDYKRLYFEPDSALARVEELGDLGAPVVSSRNVFRPSSCRT